MTTNDNQTTGAQPIQNEAQVRQLLQTYEDAAVQSIEDGENAARAGDPTLQQLILTSSIAYSNAAIMLQNKLKGY